MMALSPDGRRLALSIDRATGTELWSYDLSRGVRDTTERGRHQGHEPDLDAGWSRGCPRRFRAWTFLERVFGSVERYTRARARAARVSCLPVAVYHLARRALADLRRSGSVAAPTCGSCRGISRLRRGRC